MKSDNTNLCTGELAITNAGVGDLRLTVEPWADEAMVQPGSTVIVSFSGPPGGRMEVEIKQDGIVVYGWEGSVLSID